MSVLIDGSPIRPGDPRVRRAHHRAPEPGRCTASAAGSRSRSPRSTRCPSARTAAAAVPPRLDVRPPTVDSAAVEAADARPSGSPRPAPSSSAPGHYLAFDEGDGEFAVIRLEPGWTRIGRSGTADVRLDDPTVSRRHALVVLTDEGELRALDDRSLNGLFVNGEQVEWAPLADGDELEIGRYRLYVLEALATPSRCSGPPGPRAGRSSGSSRAAAAARPSMRSASSSWSVARSSSA